MKTIYTDALIIGGGLAGLRTAIGIKRKGHEVIVLSLCPPKRSHSAAAQGGMQASLGNTVKGNGDNEDVHFFDTVKGSDWGADQDVVRMFVDTAPKAVRELAAWGVPWNRVQKGSKQTVIDGKVQTLQESEHAHGLITARNFGGTKKWRTAYVADGTGHSMLYTMSNQAIAERIPVHERMEAMSLIHNDKRCVGAIVRNLVNGELICYLAKTTTIATGGFGRIYRNTTNAIINEGIGAAIALETGIVPLANMEAVQFHPTAIFPAGILVTEGCRGDGGLLLDKDLHRFMPDYEPDKKELASRDVVSRCMERHIAKGKGVTSRFGEHLWLDIRLLGKEHINTKLREVKEICQYFLGIDPCKELIPVRPAQHYSMGGIRTNHKGEAYSMTGLYAVGEAACWDMHGFNRLGGNSVAETVVAGMIVGEFISDFLESAQSDFQLDTCLIKQSYDDCQRYLEGFTKVENTENPFHLMKLMQQIMSEKVGIFRNRHGLEQALSELKQLQQRATKIKVNGKLSSSNPELVTAYRVDKMIKLCICVAEGALNRKESRGAHFREDFPLRNDKDWLKRTLARIKDDKHLTITYEELDVDNMELPPNWRGYGSKERIEHPKTQGRSRYIQSLLETNTDRSKVTNLLNPYKHLLPIGLRANNERIQQNEK